MSGEITMYTEQCVDITQLRTKNNVHCLILNTLACELPTSYHLTFTKVPVVRTKLR